MYKRIYIIGNSASGKSRLAKRLSRILKIKSYDLDDFYWKRKFTKKRDIKEIQKKVTEIATKEKWIIEGVYSSCIKCSIDRADLIIWLDYTFPVILLRLLMRQLRDRQKLSELFDFIRYA